LSGSACRALEIRRNAQDEDHFEKKFGDYYVAGLRIGATNATDLSAGSSSQFSSEAKAYSVMVTVKVFCWSASTTKSGSSYESSLNNSGSITFNGYDTLSAFQSTGSANDFATTNRLLVDANANLAKGKLLQGRLGETTRGVGLTDGCYVSNEQVQSLFDAGLVIELQLLPYAKLRDYISSCTRK
jgi:hypothetical protein